MIRYLLMICTLLVFDSVSHAQLIPFAFWQQRPASLVCPTGYVKVPKNIDYLANDFCVMKYEAKAEVNAGGSWDADGLSVVLADYKPSSVSNDQPWRSINRDDARTECQSLGANYDLISNAQWQTIARNLELQGANWTSGTVGTGCLFQGNNGELSCGYNGLNPEASSSNSRGIHVLSSGSALHDFAGNVAEWLRDVNGTVYGPDAHFSTVDNVSHTLAGTLSDGNSRKAKDQFGPLGSYPASDNNSGLGIGFLNYSAGAIFRGGIWNYTGDAGVFSVNLSYSSTYTSTGVGFRCVLER